MLIKKNHKSREKCLERESRVSGRRQRAEDRIWGQKEGVTRCILSLQTLEEEGKTCLAPTFFEFDESNPYILGEETSPIH